MISITDKANCTGCTSCYNICPHKSINMLVDNEGFTYPQVNLDTCINCGLCEKICPILHYSIDIKNNVLQAFAAHHKNDDIWYNSSSGGVFTALTDYIYANKGVVYGAAYDDSFQICHEKAESPNEALKFRGSKYAQSKLGDIFKDIKTDLQSNRLVLFSGTPCQIAGLKSYLNKDYQNLLTVDLICHCVPSPKVFKDYIYYIEAKYKKKIVHINMKDKTAGWPVQSPRIYFSDGSTLFADKDSYLWEKIFYSYLAIRPSCHNCKFSNLRRVGDITIGDYWGIEKYHPELNNPKGASLVLINTSKGKELFSCSSVTLHFVETDAEKALPDTLLYSTKPHVKRDQFWNEYPKLTFEQICKKYIEPNTAVKVRRLAYKYFSLLKKIIKKVHC